jgi:hypothetical protein
LGPSLRDRPPPTLDPPPTHKDVPRLRTLFGAKARPHRDHTSTSRIEAVVETPRDDLTLFKVHFGNLTLKAYTKGEHVLRFEAIVHNTRDLGMGRVLARFPQIITRLKAMLERFLTTLDCIDVAFIADQTLDQLPLPSQVGTTRIGGVDLNQPRIRAVLAAVLALAPAPGGFTVAQLATKVQQQTGQTDRAYTTRQAAYDLKQLRGKPPDRQARQVTALPHPTPRRCAPSPPCWCCATRSSSRSSPVSASPRRGRKPATWTRTDQHYETLRLKMQALFNDLGIAA